LAPQCRPVCARHGLYIPLTLSQSGNDVFCEGLIESIRPIGARCHKRRGRKRRGVVGSSVPSVSASERRDRLTKAFGPPLALLVGLVLWTLTGFAVWTALPARDHDPTIARPNGEGFSLASDTSRRIAPRSASESFKFGSDGDVIIFTPFYWDLVR
jgi:hypothetical protein